MTPQWFVWLFVAMEVLGTLTVVWTIGKPRKPITPSLAVIYIIINALWVIGMLTLVQR